VSKDQVARLCGGLDEQVTAFWERPLEVADPVSVVGRQGGEGPGRRSVEHRALVVAYGVDQAGQGEVIGLDVGAAETEAFWPEFLRRLVRGGL
jgi:putative transposase